MFSVYSKSQSRCLQIPPVCRAFSKSNKASFSNFSGVTWMGPGMEKIDFMQKLNYFERNLRFLE